MFARLLGVELLLMSNGTAPGREYLAHALETLDALLQGVDRVAFVPYAQRSLDAHTEFVAAAIRPLGVEVVGVHRGVEPHRVVESAGAVFVGGGNAFRLLAALYRHGLVQAIQSAVTRGAVYVGSSRGQTSHVRRYGPRTICRSSSRPASTRCGWCRSRSIPTTRPRRS